MTVIRMKPELLLTADMTVEARMRAHCEANLRRMAKRRSDAGRKSWETRRNVEGAAL